MPKSAPDHVASCECILLRIDGDITDMADDVEEFAFLLVAPAIERNAP